MAALQIQPGTSTDLKFATYGFISNVTDTLGTSHSNDPSLNMVNEKLRTVTVNPNGPNEVLAEEFTQAGTGVGEDTSFGSALHKAADAQRKVGKARVQMNTEINDKFIKKLVQSIETNYRTVNVCGLFPLPIPGFSLLSDTFSLLLLSGTNSNTGAVFTLPASSWTL